MFSSNMPTLSVGLAPAVYIALLYEYVAWRNSLSTAANACALPFCDLQLSALAKELESVRHLAFDVEAHNARTYHGLTCLLQLSTEDKVRRRGRLSKGLKFCLRVYSRTCSGRTHG